MTSSDSIQTRFLIRPLLPFTRSVRHVRLAGIAAHLSAATPAIWTRRVGQHVFRAQASLPVLSSAKRPHRQKIKATTLTDTESLAVLDVRCYIEREHDTKAGPRIVRRNADDLRSVAADDGFQDRHTEYEIAAQDVEYLVHHRGSRLMAVAHNALIRAKGYTQRWISETSYSTVKRTQNSALRSRFWYRQFREIVLLFALNYIKKLAETL